MDRGAWQATVHRVIRVEHDLLNHHHQGIQTPGFCFARRLGGSWLSVGLSISLESEVGLNSSFTAYSLSYLRQIPHTLSIHFLVHKVKTDNDTCVIVILRI